jgi:DNA-binding response OmpR family regulator
MSKEQILVVDDEPGMLELISMYLRREGFDVETARDGVSALHKFHDRPPSLIVLDLMLPGIDGWEVCRQVRRESGVPILMLTARDDEVDRVAGLELGADDYVVKPFSPRELVARVKAILRRVVQPEPSGLKETAPIWQWRNVRIDPNRRELIVGNTPVELRPKEFDLLWTLTQNAGVVLSRDELLNLVWGFNFLGDTRTIDVHVGYLRRKLDGAGAQGLSIKTKRSVGYMLEKF